MTPSPTAQLEDSVAGILTDVARRGITLQAHVDSGGGKLRFRPRSAMTSDLAERIKAHRLALVALLTDTTPAGVTATGPREAESGVSSVVSVSEPPERPKLGRGLWSEDELSMLARAAPGLTPADLPLVSAVKDAFADVSGGGATVVSVESAHGRGGWTRRRAAELIREARHRGNMGRTCEAVAMRDAWRERLAVCTIDGGLTEDHAEQVALNELETILYSKARTR